MIERFRSFFTNKWLRFSLIGLSGLAVLVLVFGAGFAVGRWNASPFGFFGVSTRAPREFTIRTGHGAIGMIQAIEGQRITIQSRDGKLATILVNNDTKFDKNLEKILFTDLKPNDQIIVIGSPNEDGEINARLIGLVDPSTFRFPFRTMPLPTKK